MALVVLPVTPSRCLVKALVRLRWGEHSQRAGVLSGLEKKLRHMLKTKLEYRMAARDDEDTFSRVPQWVTDLTLTRFHLGKAPPLVTAAKLVSQDAATGKVAAPPSTPSLGSSRLGPAPGHGRGLVCAFARTLTGRMGGAACTCE